MKYKDYTLVTVCGDHPDDPAVNEWYVEISRPSGPNSRQGFCELRKRDGKVVIEIGELDVENSYQHNFENFMMVLKRAGEMALSL